MSDPSAMNVLFIASEAEPFAKVGGLADVAGSLPRALQDISRTSASDEPKINIRLVVPYHPLIQRERFSPQLVAKYSIPTLDGPVQARAFFLEDDGLPVYFIGGDPIDQETGVYSANLEEDGYKYVFFSLACLELARQLDWRPDILHANDWHTAAAVYSLSLQRPGDPFFSRTASLLTVHNLPYLGSMTPAAMEAFGLPPAVHSDLPAWAAQMALPLGLLSADSIVAVSPGYAREILTEEFGSGLAFFLQAHAAKISGILNGLDTRKWDPQTDQYLAANYLSGDLQARSHNKAYLQRSMGFEIDQATPLLAMVTRLDPQKGVDLAVDAIRSMIQSKAQPFQMVFLGSGNPVLESQLRLLEHHFPHQVRTHIAFNEQLSHSIYSGADMLLMPSLYEPCGLSQMIAMRYGCVPIARATGGLCDTIHDPLDNGESTGFLFTPPKSEALVNAIQRAVSLYLQDRSKWQEMQLRGMQQDFSWHRSGLEYLKRYKSILR